MLSCYSFTDLGRDMRLLGLKQWIWLLMVQHAAWVSHSPWFSSSLEHHGAMELGPGVRHAPVGLCHSWGSPNSGNPHSYKGLLANMLNLCPREKHYLYYTDRKTNFPSAPEGVSISIFQGCFPRKDSPEWKLSQAFTKSERAMEKLSPQKGHSPFWLLLLTTIKDEVISSLVPLILFWWHRFNVLLSSEFPLGSQKWAWKSKAFLRAICITAITIPPHLQVTWMPSESPGDKSPTGQWRKGNQRDYRFKLYGYILICKRTFKS